MEALEDVVARLNEPDPDPATACAALVQVFPWNRRRRALARYEPQVQRGDKWMPVVEAQVLGLAAINDTSKRDGAMPFEVDAPSRKRRKWQPAPDSDRQIRKAELFRTLARLRGLARGVADSSRDSQVVFTAQRGLRYRIAAGRVLVGGDWPDVIAWHLLDLCRSVGFERIGACSECGNLFVAWRRGRRRYCSDTCGTRLRVRASRAR